MFYDNSKPLNEQKTYPVVPSNISNFKTDFDFFSEHEKMTKAK